MNDYKTYVGMDVHARSIMCRGMCKETGEAYTRLFAGRPAAAEVHGWLASLPQPVYCAYESGCTGFWLARELRALGDDCDVIAVSTLPRSAKDRLGKCDKLDARVILRAIVNPAPDCSRVWIPDAETEGARDLSRARQDAAKAVKSAKQRVTSLLLRHGFVWDERTPSGGRKKAWGREFRRWLGAIELPDPGARAALGHYRRCVERAEEELAEMDALVRARAEEPRWKPYVDAISHLKGVDVVAAFAAAAEFGDFSRFASGRKVSCWLGTVPKNGSSGERESHGGITKAGSPHLRMYLVEGCCGMDRWGEGGKAPKGRDASPEVKAIAAKANARLRKRYRHLRDDLGKGRNKAKIAVVNELVRWIWVIGLQVRSELAA